MASRASIGGLEHVAPGGPSLPIPTASPWVKVGMRMGVPRQLSESNYGHRQAGNSHWHQDIRVTAAATGDIAEAFHHLSCHFAGTALEALVGKHGHP